ncbi:OmpA family protein [Klebsiella pneumoniae]|uniref:OmpA family protein n=1 Tax=Klebsiella pneumoniae TaxID=573 RepID=UPI00132FFAC3|nr:OmpA family protein [Klebsiella pneumoniae]
MSPAQQRGLALWASLLSALVCLLFLPVPRWGAWLILLVTLALIIGIWRIASRRTGRNVASTLAPLPEGAYRQPVVLVCGDLPCVWPPASPVRVVKQGCWIRVEKTEDLQQVARQVLSQRPEWGPQLSVLLCVCPQRHAQSDALTSALLALRWQLSQLRQQTGYAVPLALQGQVGSAMSRDLLWQAAIPGEAVKVWQPSCAPCSVPAWVSAGGAAALEQQVLMNSLMGWFEQHVHAVLTEENTDLPPLPPAAVLWGLGPSLPGSLASSAWTTWLSRHSGLSRVAGWQPGESDTGDASALPEFILPQLPAGRGLTPRGWAWRAALAIFTLAAVAALLSSGWNNRQLLQRVGVDIARYERIAMDDYRPKASAVRVLREDAALLDSWARNGVPLRLSLGLYHGEQIRLPLLEAIRGYVPPPPPPRPVQHVAPDVILLDSMSLFDTGKWVLKPGSTKRLVSSLMDIKARPGWLIVVAGHTDSVGEEKANQLLSLKRAESVRDWMRDTGDVPDSCFAVQGYGESRPIATNDTPEGRALNRRVEISLVPQVDACRLPDQPSASSQDDGASLHNGE